MSDEGRVMPTEEMHDISLRQVAPVSGEGALGKWRASSGSTVRTLSRTTVYTLSDVELEV